MIEWFLDSWKDILFVLCFLVMISVGASITLENLLASIFEKTPRKDFKDIISDFGLGVTCFIMGILLLINSMFT